MVIYKILICFILKFYHIWLHFPIYLNIKGSIYRIFVVSVSTKNSLVFVFIKLALLTFFLHFMFSDFCIQKPIPLVH